MEVLENATIVKNLSDPTSLGNVWSMARGLIDTVEFTEQVWDIARKHPNTLFSLSDEDSFNNWCRLWDSFEKQWKEDLEYLNLDNLDFWLVDESNDIAELSFKLNKVKCRVGELWDLDKANQLNTNLLNLTDRLAEIILTLKRNAYMCMYDLEEMENFAGHRAWEMIQHVCKWVRDIIKIQERMQKIIRGAESILNPQPDTSTEQEQTVKRSPITDEKGIKIAFDLAEEKELMRLEGVYYRWLSDNALLAYFCERLYNVFLNMTKGNKSWGYFSFWFIVKGKDGRDIIPDGVKLNRYKTDWKADRLLDREDPFCPDGDEIIDEIILSAKK